MGSRNLPVHFETSPEIEELARQLEQWRNDPMRARRIPDPLWATAGRLARRYGVYNVARRLHLDYYSLKKRMRSGPETRGGEPRHVETAFIELPAVTSATISECSIEVDHPRGARMMIHVKGTGLPDLASITRAFCGGKE
jgi:hypothetical protein